MPGVTTAYQVGDHASRPAASAGCILYSCTTHGLVYRSDGSAWATWLTLPSGAAAHAASHEDGGADEIDVTGLVGAGGGGGGGTYTIDAIATGVATEVTPSGNVVWSDGVDGLNGRDILSVKFNSVTSDHVCAQLIPIGSATVIETAFRASGPHTNNNMAGPIFTNGTTTTSGAIWARWTWGGAVFSGSLFLTHGGTLSAVNVAADEYSPGLHLGGPLPLIFIRLTKVAANTWRMEFSIDGVTWTTFGISDVSRTFTPTHMGVGVSNYGGGVKDRLVTFEYFKHNG